MIEIGIFNRFKNKAITVSQYKMITERGNGFYSYDGNLYQSDIVRSCIRPKAQAIGKTEGKHIRNDPKGGIKINPEPYIRILLEEPNPLMTGQMLKEKLIVQLMLNNNAFAYIQRDENGYPIAIYPITSNKVDGLQDENGELFLKFYCRNAKSYTFRYSDIIHLRRDFGNNDLFGDSQADALASLMEIVTTTDQGIVKAIKNSAIIRWLLKFNATLRPEDLKKQTKQFVEDFLKVESGDGVDDSTVGAAATDSRFDAQQIEPKDYVPNEKLVDRTTKRIHSFFNTNEKIIQSAYSEDEWISYYEAECERDIMQLSKEYTRRLFTRKERGHGNKIIFESSNLTFASMATKLGLVQFVDRAILNPNEVRAILNLAPIEGGGKYIRRLDTRPTEEDDNTERRVNG